MEVLLLNTANYCITMTDAVHLSTLWKVSFDLVFPESDLDIW